MFVSNLETCIQRGSRVLVRRLSITPTKRLLHHQQQQQQPRVVVLLGSLVIRPGNAAAAVKLRPSSGMALRAFSSSNTNKDTSSKQSTNDQESGDKKKPDDEETSELVLTPGQQVVMAGRLTMWAGIAAFAAVCAYYIIRELMPTYVHVLTFYWETNIRPKFALNFFLHLHTRTHSHEICFVFLYLFSTPLSVWNLMFVLQKNESESRL